MARFVVRRLVQMVLVLFAVSVLTFLIFNVIPNGDPAVRMAGRQPTESTIEAIREEWGFDEPLYVQYVKTMKKVFTGDLESLLHPAQRRRGDPQGAAAHAVAGDRRGDHVDVLGDLPRPLQRGEGGQVRRPLPDDPRAGRHLDAGLLGRGADELLPRLQARLVPQRRLRAAHRGPGRLGLPPDPALDRAVDPVHRLLLARAALERARHDERGLRAHRAREGAVASAR